MQRNITTLEELDSLARFRRLDHPFGTTQWRIWGKGPSLILLHGGWGSWRHWFRNIEPLSRHFQVLVPDMPGFGDSDPLEATSVAAIAENLSENIDRLPVSSRLSIAGFSFGAWVAGHMLAHRRNRIDCMIMVGAGGLGRVNSRRNAMRSWRFAQSDEERMAAHRHNLQALMLARPETIDDTAILIQAQNAEATRFRHRLANDSMLLKDCLEHWPVSVAAIWGQDDVVVKGYLEERREALMAIDPQSRLHVVPKAGHWVQYEEPDAVNALLIEELLRKRDRLNV
ncbi:alpha/beta hydrolase [Hoeflea sp. WL0058]|uniref:Alpha/beta hydrolase n=1 Tax=Flavimaribacter sediminis TaxID=2865987 RepID=A0AAE3D3Q8_9HYPH|nr:alpha/beta hydrolase [Flavimaribacter sediminis]MBW8640086.1 alpha/beta hydrolase [Flavimaribacter sediminis]